jgi:hypothetical protein
MLTYIDGFFDDGSYICFRCHIVHNTSPQCLFALQTGARKKCSPTLLHLVRYRFIQTVKQQWLVA